MTDRRWGRLAAATGVVFVVLVAVAVVIGARAPTPADTAEDVVSYYLDKRGAVLAQAYLLRLDG